MSSVDFGVSDFCSLISEPIEEISTGSDETFRTFELDPASKVSLSIILERVRPQWERAVSSGSALEIEVRLRKGDGSYRWFLNRYNPVRDDQGQVVRWYAAATDIEDRKRVEDRLDRENAALR
jgi:PAS domain-containing protein